MKLLLTSEGLTNKKIRNAFFDLVCKEAKDISLVYIPTAANVSTTENKRWVVNAIVCLDKLGIGNIDFVDISAIPKDLWLPRIERADIIYVEGGNILYLKEWMIKSGFSDQLNKFLETKVYVGSSAGSMILGENLITSRSEKEESGFGIVSFSLRPHYNRPKYSAFNKEMLSKLAKKSQSIIYGIDDDTAIKIDGDKIEVISEGKWDKFIG